MSLGDLFPENLRNDYAVRNIEVGCVIKKLVPFIRPPKEKGFVVVAFDSDKVALAVVLINTVINEKVNYSNELKSLHISLDHQDREYLDYPSFVDCSDLYEVSVSSIKDALVSDPSCFKGKMKQADLSKVHRLIIQSTAIKPFKKKRYGFA